MSILCIICKEKLISHFPDGKSGSDSQNTENIQVSTACGHLFHLECIQSWFLTQKRKFQIRGNSEFNSNLCPSCQSPVKDDDYRRIFPLEDHGGALEKAKLFEKLENLEIYCHQLEIQIQQLAKENDVLLNKVLTPPTSPRDGFDTIVKNDRVMWMRPAESPASGVVLSIFKKEGQLCAKIRLDKKHRANQRTSRILSSFRFDKKQEVTVPFDEIVLAKDLNENLTQRFAHHTSVPNNMNMSNGGNNEQYGGGIGGKSYSTANIPQQYYDFTRGSGQSINGSVTTASTSSGITGSFSSTVSLPDESRRLEGIQESIEDLLQSASAVPAQQQQNTRIPLNRSISCSPAFNINSRVVPGSISSVTPEPPSRDASTPPSRSNSETSIDCPRDYVFITPQSWRGSQKRGANKSQQGRLSPPDGKNKHVTFADEPSKFSVTAGLKVPEEANSLGRSTSAASEMSTTSSVKCEGMGEKVVGFLPIPMSRPKSKKKSPPPKIPPQPMPRPRSSFTGSESSSTTIESVQAPVPPTRNELPISAESPENNAKPSNNSTSKEALPIFEISRYETITRSNIPLKYDINASIDSTGTVNITELLQDFQEGTAQTETTNSCIDVTLLALLYRSIGFDNLMLKSNYEDTEISRKIKWIVKENFVNPIRQFRCTGRGSTQSINETLAHLSSGEMDVEELMTILFEYLFKLTPFINYSLAMCDYLHQFFIDFTDNMKIRTVQSLLEKSLSIQDNLKLEGKPNPALILQMRHSNDGVIHYDAVVPNLTLNMKGLIETRDIPRCYCGRKATLQCKACMEINADTAVLGCDRCKEVLEGVHKINGGHQLELLPVNSTPSVLETSSTSWSLSSIICFKDEHYTVFLKDGAETYSPWVYVHSISGVGKLQMKNLPGFGYWLENLVDRYESLNLQQIPPLLLKVLKYSRVYIYVPVTSSTI